MQVGDRIEEKFTKCQGTITKVGPGFVLVLFDSGFQDMIREHYFKYISVIPKEDKEVVA